MRIHEPSGATEATSLEFFKGTAKNRVVLVSSDLSSNSLGRTLLLSELLQPFTRVRVVGHQIDPDIWAPARRTGHSVEGVRITHSGKYWRARRWLREKLSGSRVVVCKPLATSLGLALAAGLRRDQLLLDNDDWEIGLHRSHPEASSLRSFLNPRRVNSYWSTCALDRLIRHLPYRIASNRWLQRRYGGALIPHVRDTELLRPSAERTARMRAELGMHGRVWVGFVGTIRAHKGVDRLVEAVARHASAGLYLAGVELDDRVAGQVVELARARLPRERLRVIPPFSFAELPRWLAAPDILCMPSKRSAAAAGQLPAKLFDAMAMGKAVVVTPLNDMESVLGGAGLIAASDGAEDLFAAIARVADDAALRQTLGRRARQRAVRRFSHDAARGTLLTQLGRVKPFEEV